MNAHCVRPVPARLLLALGLVACGGCSSIRLDRVAPWARGTLADPIMRPDRDPLATAMNEHIYTSREEATGGSAVGGSGCGCN